MKEELLKSLTKEQIAKLKECKSQEDMLKIAKEEGVELTDEQLEAVSGGCGGTTERCPKCDSDRVGDYWVKYYIDNHVLESMRTYKKCSSCGYEWNENWTDFL